MRLARGAESTLAFSSKKRKVLETAQKYAQKGAYDKALREYEKLLKADPKDTNIRLKIGDLHLKKGDPVKAIESYTQVAEEFSRGGFDAKAVAIYKQILRADDDCLGARISLGDHFQRMGLASDALREFQEAIALCQRKDLKREAFELLKRVASLDPGNVPNRLNLAELFVRESMLDEAREEYSLLLDEVNNQTSSEMMLRVAEAAAAAFPDHLPALSAIATAKTRMGEHAGAIETLQGAISTFPDEMELRESLIVAYEAMSDEEGARRTYREMAELYKRRGDSDKARDILQRFVPVEPFNAGAENTSPSLLLEDETRGSGKLGLDLEDDELDLDDASLPEVTLQTQPRPVAPPKSRAKRTPATKPTGAAKKPAPTMSSDQADELIAEARVSVEFGDPDAAIEIVERVLAATPDHAAAQALLDELKSGAAPLEQGPLGDIAVGPSSSDGVRVSDLGDVEFGNVEEDLGGELTSPGQDTLPDIEIILEDEDDADGTFASVEPPAELLVSSPADTKLDPLEVAQETAPELEPASAEPELEDLEFELEFDEESEEDVDDSTSSAWAAQSTRISSNLDEAGFFIGQSMFDDAERLLNEILEQVPNHPQAMLRLGEIEARRAEALEDDSENEEKFGDTRVDDDDEIPEIPEIDLPGDLSGAGESTESLELDLAADLADDLSDALADLSDEPSVVAEVTEPAFDAVELDDEPLAIAEETEPNLDVELEPVGFEPELEVVAEEEPELVEAEAVTDSPLALAEEEADEDGFDLAAELADEFDGDTTAAPSEGGFEDVFSAFKKGIQEQLSDDEVDAHYDLAIAYREMGLLEDAVRELEIVQRGGERAVEALSLMANCKLELGRPEDAAADLEAALALAGDSHESIVALRYELGEALAAAGRPGEALEAFQKVAAADANHREVGAKIAELDQG